MNKDPNEELVNFWQGSLAKDQEIFELRKLLWIWHGHTTFLYGDDGEMQCGKCMLDFRRDSIEKIVVRFDKMELEKLEEYYRKKGEIKDGGESV